MEKISKNFGPIKAVQDVDLMLQHDEILAIAGDNAAGKSTLMKILAGVFPPDAGRVLVEGQEVHFGSPIDARRLGIETVYQDYALVKTLDIPHNVFLAREPTRKFLNLITVVDAGQMKRLSRETLKKIGFEIEYLDSKVRDLSGGQQQAVSISRAIQFNPKILIMDEPTANLSLPAIEKVLEVIRILRDRMGISVVLITHRITDIFKVANRVMIMRAGRKVAENDVSSVTMDDIVRSMAA
jgi:simple sugar transport system ATP-binding protein